MATVCDDLTTEQRTVNDRATHDCAGRWQGERSGWKVLLASIAVIAGVWLGVLPAISRVPAIRADIDRVDAAGINASALYWTELDNERLWREQPLSAARESSQTRRLRKDAP